MVEKPIEIGIDDLIPKMPLEERLYRHRCVEAWCMAVPWTGFPLAKLVEFAKPLVGGQICAAWRPSWIRGGARRSRQNWYPWPYIGRR